MFRHNKQLCKHACAYVVSVCIYVCVCVFVCALRAWSGCCVIEGFEFTLLTWGGQMSRKAWSWILEEGKLLVRGGEGEGG